MVAVGAGATAVRGVVVEEVALLLVEVRSGQAGGPTAGRGGRGVRRARRPPGRGQVVVVVEPAPVGPALRVALLQGVVESPVQPVVHWTSYPARRHRATPSGAGSHRNHRRCTKGHWDRNLPSPGRPSHTDTSRLRARDRRRVQVGTLRVPGERTVVCWSPHDLEVVGVGVVRDCTSVLWCTEEGV